MSFTVESEFDWDAHSICLTKPSNQYKLLLDSSRGLSMIEHEETIACNFFITKKYQTSVIILKRFIEKYFSFIFDSHYNKLNNRNIRDYQKEKIFQEQFHFEEVRILNDEENEKRVREYKSSNTVKKSNVINTEGSNSNFESNNKHDGFISSRINKINSILNSNKKKNTNNINKTNLNSILKNSAVLNTNSTNNTNNSISNSKANTNNDDFFLNKTTEITNMTNANTEDNTFNNTNNKHIDNNATNKISNERKMIIAPKALQKSALSKTKESALYSKDEQTKRVASHCGLNFSKRKAIFAKFNSVSTNNVLDSVKQKKSINYNNSNNQIKHNDLICTCNENMNTIKEDELDKKGLNNTLTNNTNINEYHNNITATTALSGNNDNNTIHSKNSSNRFNTLNDNNTRSGLSSNISILQNLKGSNKNISIKNITQSNPNINYNNNGLASTNTVHTFNKNSNKNQITVIKNIKECPIHSRKEDNIISNIVSKDINKSNRDNNYNDNSNSLTKYHKDIIKEEFFLDKLVQQTMTDKELQNYYVSKRREITKILIDDMNKKIKSNEEDNGFTSNLNDRGRKKMTIKVKNLNNHNMNINNTTSGFYSSNNNLDSLSTHISINSNITDNLHSNNNINHYNVGYTLKVVANNSLVLAKSLVNSIKHNAIQNAIEEVKMSKLTKEEKELERIKLENNISNMNINKDNKQLINNKNSSHSGSGNNYSKTHTYNFHSSNNKKEFDLANYNHLKLVPHKIAINTNNVNNINMPNNDSKYTSRKIDKYDLITNNKEECEYDSVLTNKEYRKFMFHNLYPYINYDLVPKEKEPFILEKTIEKLRSQRSITRLNQTKKKCYNNYKSKFKQFENELDTFAVKAQIRCSSDYIPSEVIKRKNDMEDKKKWVCDNDFRKVFPVNHDNEPWKNVSHEIIDSITDYNFRDIDKQKWLASNFKFKY